jgi:hypothetical protein
VHDRKRAKNAALTTGAVVFAAGAGASLRLGHYRWFLASILLGVVAYFVQRRVATARAPKGVLDLEDDSRLGVMLTLRRRGHTLYRVPLKEATIIGRTRTLSVGAVRMQIEVRWPDGVFVASLAVPFRGAPFDEEGVLPSTIDLDRTASRALDALSYEVAEQASPSPTPAEG